MTVVEFDLGTPAPDGTPAAGKGFVEGVPTKIITAGDTVVLPDPFAIDLVAGKVNVTCTPTIDGLWAWIFVLHLDVGDYEFLKIVPDSIEPVKFRDLADADADTLDPSAPVSPVWAAFIDVKIAAQHALDDVEYANAAATAAAIAEIALGGAGGGVTQEELNAEAAARIAADALKADVTALTAEVAARTAAVAAVGAAAVNDGDGAGGVLSGAFPNPGFAVDMATQGELAAKANSADLAAVATSGDYADMIGTIPTSPGDVASVNGQIGVVVLDQDDILDGITANQYTVTDKAKLSGIGAGATANDTDANLRDRATHTGSQAQSTITGLVADLGSKATSAALTDEANARTAADALKANSADLGTAATKDVPAAGNAAAGEVVLGNDGRLSDSRTPIAHSHAIADTTGLQGALDGKSATGHTHAYSSLTSPPTLGTASPLNVPASGNAAVGEVVKGNDTRLSDARTPTAHGHSADDITDGTTNKAFLATERTKLAGVAAAATANSTDAALRDRTTHTGTQAQSTVTNLVTDLAAKQPLDADLTTIAGLTPTTDNVIQSVAGAWASRTMAQLKAALALVKGDVGLANVDNTSDASKPVSTAQAAADTAAKARANHTGTQSADSLVDGSANKVFTAAEQTKLAGVAAAATANATDAALRDRATHTGVQTIATVTSLQASLDAKVAGDGSILEIKKITAAAHAALVTAGTTVPTTFYAIVG